MGNQRAGVSRAKHPCPNIIRENSGPRCSACRTTQTRLCKVDPTIEAAQECAALAESSGDRGSKGPRRAIRGDEYSACLTPADANRHEFRSYVAVPRGRKQIPLRCEPFRPGPAVLFGMPNKGGRAVGASGGGEDRRSEAGMASPMRARLGEDRYGSVTHRVVFGMPNSPRRK